MGRTAWATLAKKKKKSNARKRTRGASDLVLVSIVEGIICLPPRRRNEFGLQERRRQQRPVDEGLGMNNFHKFSDAKDPRMDI